MKTFSLLLGRRNKLRLSKQLFLCTQNGVASFIVIVQCFNHARPNQKFVFPCIYAVDIDVNSILYLISRQFCDYLINIEKCYQQYLRVVD